MTAAQALEIHKEIEKLQRGMGRIMEALEAAWSERNPEGRSYQTLDYNDILVSVAAAYKLHPEELIAKTNQRTIARPRMVAQYLMREILHMSFTEIALATRRKNHSTPFSAVDKIGRRRKVDKELDNLLTSLEKQLRANWRKSIA